MTSKVKTYQASLFLTLVLFGSLLFSAIPTQDASAKLALAATRTATRTRTKTPRPTQTPTKRATVTRTKTKTPAKTFTKTLTRTVTRTRTNTATLTKTPSLTRTMTVTPTQTYTVTFTATPTKTFTPTSTYTPTQTVGASASATVTLTKTFTFTPTGTDTATPTSTYPPTQTVGASASATVTPTETFTFTPTWTDTVTLTATPTETFTPTSTLSYTPSATPTLTATATITPTSTSTSTVTSSSTSTPSITPTPTLALFHMPTLYAASEAFSTVSDDFNNDGLQDTAVGAFDGNLLIYLQDSNGGLPVTPVSYTIGSVPYFIASGDLNHDGLKDVVVSLHNSNQIGVFLQQLDGTLAPMVAYATSGPAVGVVVGDLNSDGLNDIAVANYSVLNRFLDVFIQKPDGTFNDLIQYPAYGYGFSLAIGDVNGDGRNDLVETHTPSDTSSSIDVYLQNNDGTLALPVALGCSTCGSSYAVKIGDLTNDGRNDIVVSFYTSTVAIFVQDSSGNLQPPVIYTTGQQFIAGLALKDVNKDGLNDLIAVSKDGSAASIAVYLGQGGVSLTMGWSSPLPASTYGSLPDLLSVADVNHDTWMDLLVTRSSGLVVFYNHPNIAPTPTATLTSTSTRTPTPTTTRTPTLTPTSIYTPTATPIPTLALFHAPPITYSSSGAFAVAADDFNHDGLQDAAVGTSDGNLLVYLQNNDGSLPTNPVTYVIGSKPYFIKSGDVNHDGLKDVVVSILSTNQIGVFLQQPSGSLATMVAYSTSGPALGMVVGDINNDGLDDIAVVNHTSISLLDVFIQNPNGSLNPRIGYTAPAQSFNLAIGDVNGDSLNDLVVTTDYASNINVYLQNNDGTLAVPILLPCNNCGASFAIKIGDITNDSRNDVVVALSYTSNLAIFAQDSSGNLQPAVIYSSGQPSIVALALNDVNNDGLNDLVAIGNDPSHPSVDLHLGQNNGSLSKAWSYPLATNFTFPNNFDVADINHDGWLDLLVTRSSGLLVFYNGYDIPPIATQTPTPAPTALPTKTVTPTPTP